MTRVYFHNSWNERPSDLLKRYSRQTPGCSGIWKNIVGVEDPSKADVVIVLGGTRGYGEVFRGKEIIFVTREPDFIEKPPNLQGVHTLEWTKNHTGITWWVNKTYDELKSLEYPNKKKKISCVVSSKHSRRLSFVQRLFSKECKIDLWGRGHAGAYNGKDFYMGELNYSGNCKLNGLLPYEYTVVLENSSQNNYWTEKLADAYLSWCFPIYWGCPNINEFFKEKSFKSISIDDPNPHESIMELINSPLTENEFRLIKESREAILENYNIWEVIRKKIIDLGLEHEVL